MSSEIASSDKFPPSIGWCREEASFRLYFVAQGAIVSSDELSEYPLSREELEIARRIANKRARALFCAGRRAAREALISAGNTHPSPVLRGESGEPVWPEGFSGSLTHTSSARNRERGVAVAAVASGVFGVGIDIESLDRHCSPDLVEKIAFGEEREWVGGDPLEILAVISAKEALYKALWPLTKIFFGFAGAKLVRLPAEDGAAFRAELTEPLSERFSLGFSARIFQETREEFLLSWVVIEGS